MESSRSFSILSSDRINLVISVQSWRRFRKQGLRRTLFPAQPPSYPQSHRSNDLLTQNYKPPSEPPQKDTPIPASALPTLPTSTIVNEWDFEPPSCEAPVTPYTTPIEEPAMLSAPATTPVSEIPRTPWAKSTLASTPLSIVTLQADPPVQVALYKVLPVELL